MKLNKNQQMLIKQIKEGAFRDSIFFLELAKTKNGFDVYKHTVIKTRPDSDEGIAILLMYERLKGLGNCYAAFDLPIIGTVGKPCKECKKRKKWIFKNKNTSGKQK